MLVVITVMSVVFVAACKQSESHGPEETRRSVASEQRSVVLVTVDTTRPDRLEPYGADNVATPVMSSLAQNGVVFERAWAVAPITLVAHTSILSGLNPFEHRVHNNGTQYVSDDVTTLAERLQDQGYRTGAFVSAAVLDRRYGLDQGFEHYDDDLSDRRNVSPRMVADRTAEATVAAATAWVDTLEQDDKYFVWVHFYDPHASYSPPPPFRDEYRDRLYDGEIAYMDQQLGRLLEHPRFSSEGSDAPIVMVIGDHGESLGEHGERTHAILTYDSTLAIPFLLQVPGGPAGLRVAEPVGQVDVKPTVLSLLGLLNEEDASEDTRSWSGRDLVPVIEGRARDPRRAYYSETFLPFYTYGWSKLKVLHRERWKYIDAPTPELYDRVRDPRELSSVIDQQAGLAHDMKRDLDEWLAEFDSDQEATLDLDSDSVAMLRSLGYLSVGSGSTDYEGERPNPMEMISQHVGLERARMFLADRLYDQAIRQLESVLERDPRNLAALIDLMRAQEGSGDVEEAIRTAERALELDPDYTQTLFNLARLEAQRDQLDRALELTDLAIERDPKSAEARILKATFLQRAGRADEIQETLEAALVDNPDHPRTNAVYAHLVLSRTGQIDAAEERLRTALERDPFLDQGWLFLGRLLEKRQDVEGAEESYRQGLLKRPDNAELHGAQGHLLARRGRHAEAEVQLREAIRLSAQDRTEFYVSLGGVLSEMGRIDEAKREYDKVLAMRPDHPGARNNAAIALYRSGDVAGARRALLEVVEAFPRHADAHNNLAAIAVDQGQWQDAIVHSRRTLELAPELSEAWNNLAIGLEETGKLDQAASAYDKALELEPAYWQARFNLGLLHKKKGDTGGALQAFNDVLSQVPNHGESHLELGELYAGPLADPARARVHWNAFLRHSPQHPRGPEMRQRLAAL